MLKMLQNCTFNRIHRAADMLCLGLGEDIHTRHGVCPEYSLHVQAQWRFRKGGKILLGSNDIYFPYNENVPEDWAYDPIGRPDCESSIFDVMSKNLSQRMHDAHIVNCNWFNSGDLRLDFSNDVVFELFISASRKAEEWRLIDSVNNVHIICFDDNGFITHERE